MRASSGRALLANQKPVCDGSVAGPSERMELGHFQPVSRLRVVGPPYGSVHPTGQKSNKCPQVEGHVLALSSRHAKRRREGYRRKPTS